MPSVKGLVHETFSNINSIITILIPVQNEKNQACREACQDWAFRKTLQGPGDGESDNGDDKVSIVLSEK